MLNKDLYLNFSPHLERPGKRSLSLVFILQEIAQQFERIQKLKESQEPLNEDISSFFCLSHPYPQMGMCPDKLCFYSDILLQATKIKDHSLLDELNEMRTFICLLYTSRCV